MKNILVINSGSSSLKFQLIQMPSEEVLASGLVERIGQGMGKLKYESSNFNFNEEMVVPDHSVALRSITDILLDPVKGVIKKTTDIFAVGHRVVHGGDKFSETIIIDSRV